MALTSREKYLRWKAKPGNKENKNAIDSAQSKARKPGLRLIVDARKAAPCMDCGLSYPSVVMDFDHREPSAKKYNISFLAKRGSGAISTLLKEIDKCDLVCSNCHRIRTAKLESYLGTDLSD